MIESGWGLGSSLQAIAKHGFAPQGCSFYLVSKTGGSLVTSAVAVPHMSVPLLCLDTCPCRLLWCLWRRLT